MHNLAHPVPFNALPAGIGLSAEGLQSFTDALYPSIVLLVLATAAVGIFTGLTVFAALVLIQRSLKNLAVLFLFVTTLLMYASSVVYWVSLLLNAIGLFNIVQSYGVQLSCQAHFLLLSSFNPNHSLPDTCTSSEYGLRGAVRGLTLCAPTIILAINVVLGDAIVWWRVWVLWPRSILVRGSCLILLWTTFSAGLFDVNDSCPASAFTDLRLSNLGKEPVGALFEKDLWGLAASVLSLATNLVATALIGIKAWEHRHVMKKAPLKRSTRVERVLILLIESGALYCLLWMSVVAYQFVDQLGLESTPPKLAALLNGYDYFLKGCLIPLVGMYPTAIVILVALDKSHFGASTMSTMSTIVFERAASHPPSSTLNRTSTSYTNDYEIVASSDHALDESGSAKVGHDYLGLERDKWPGASSPLLVPELKMPEPCRASTPDLPRASSMVELPRVSPAAVDLRRASTVGEHGQPAMLHVEQ